MPDAEQGDVKVAVNDFLKAITASLLMEQVMAPSWHFKTVKDDDDNLETARTIIVEGLKPLSSEKTKLIVQEQLDDLKACYIARRNGGAGYQWFNHGRDDYPKPDTQGDS